MKAIAVVGLLLLPSVALAAANQSFPPGAVVEQASVNADGPISNYGTASRSFLTLTAWDARPIDSSVTYDYVNSPGGQGITRTGGLPFFKVPVHLPAGALVSEVELNYCDTGVSNLIIAWVRQVKNAPAVFSGLHQSQGAPGCVVVNSTLMNAETIDNNANSYNIEIALLGGADGTLVFLSARVGYRLQVSPAPATATFPNDVPTTHPFFRFVEALAAAGITGGCGAGAYCPDQPVTRGQMAVFLATALGLHWPN